MSLTTAARPARSRIRLAASTLWLLTTMIVLAQTSRVYISPDHALRAVSTDNAAHELLMRVERISPARLLMSRDGRSADGEHGTRLVRAAWTGDSQFFVVSTTSSGGHQPWHFPLWVYSRAKDRVFEMWNLGVLATGEFKLKAPDMVEVRILCPGNPAYERDFEFSLRRLASTGSVPNPCSIH